jgi:hypothetical protein
MTLAPILTVIKAVGFSNIYKHKKLNHCWYFTFICHYITIADNSELKMIKTARLPVV